MTVRTTALLLGLGVAAGCTQYHPIDQGAGNWNAARELAYAGAAAPTAVSEAPTDLGLAEPAPSSVQVQSIPPLGEPVPAPPSQSPQALGGISANDPVWADNRSAFDAAPAEPIEVAALPDVTEPELAAAEPPSAEPVEAAAPAATETRRPTDLPPPALSGLGFLWPADGAVRNATAGGPAGHIANGLVIDASPGAPIVAAENGVVVYASSEMAAYGNMAVIRHDGNYTTAYGHADNLTVAPGDIVRRGQQIGTVGSSGGVDDPQLYFEMRAGSDVVEPTAYLSPRA